MENKPDELVEFINIKTILIAFIMALVLLVLVENSSADSGYIWVDGVQTSAKKQDCSVHKFVSNDLSVGIKFGTFLFGVGPEIAWGSRSGINWHPNIQNIIVRYERLCTDYNSGIITKDEYKSRLVAIEALETDYQQSRWRHETEMFDELDRLTEKNTF